MPSKAITFAFPLLWLAVLAQQPGPSSPTAPSTTQQQAPHIATNTVSLPPFNAITLCSPLNVFVAPSTNRTFEWTITAEPEVISHVNATVAPYPTTPNSAPVPTLSLTTLAPGFNTTQTIEITIFMPPDALQSITHDGPNAQIYLGPGFNVPFLNISTGFGAGSLYGESLTVTQTLSITHDGLGALTVTGSLNNVNITASSLAPVSVATVSGTTSLALSSSATAYINQSPTSIINGFASGLNKVYFSEGDCRVSSPFSGGFSPSTTLNPCVQQAFLFIPPPQPVWTCGTAVNGSFECQPGASILSISGGAGGGGGGVSGGTSGGSFSSSSTTTGGGGGTVSLQQSQQTTGTGGGASSSAFASTSSSSTGGGRGGFGTTSTQITQNGNTQGFTSTTSTSPGSSIAGAGNTVQFSNGGVVLTAPNQPPITATYLSCAAPLNSTRIMTSPGGG